MKGQRANGGESLRMLVQDSGKRRSGSRKGRTGPAVGDEEEVRTKWKYLGAEDTT